MALAGSKPTVLATGATGYIGGRLVARLLVAGCRIDLLRPIRPT